MRQDPSILLSLAGCTVQLPFPIYTPAKDPQYLFPLKRGVRLYMIEVEYCFAIINIFLEFD